MFRSPAIEYLTRDSGTHTGAWRIVTLRHALSWWISGFIPGIDADVRGDGTVYWFRTRGLRYHKRADHVIRDDGPRVEVVQPSRCGARSRVGSPLGPPVCFLPSGHAGSHVCGHESEPATYIAFPRCDA
jgi:hypothetical protein